MILLYVITSFIVGFGLGLIFFYKPSLKPMGVIRVDRSDPDDPPYLFLELANKKIVDKLGHGDIVCFQVSTENYISQE